MTAGLALRFEADTLDDPRVVDLLREHVAAAYANSPPEQAFVLDVSSLRAPGISFWSAWDGANLVGMGALKLLEPGHAEIKSMRVAAAYLRRGIGAAIVEHLLAQARAQGITRVSLETGGNDAFAAARAMYERAGFTRCGPFAGYPDSAFNLYYSMPLQR